MSLSNSSEEIYNQLIDIRKTLYEQHSAVQSELDDIKDALQERLSPIEEKVTRHEHTFNVMAKVATWIFPSGVALGLIGWLNNFFLPHK